MIRLNLCLIFTVCVQLATPADPALTIYNQGFSVIRETIPMEWSSGVSEVRFSGVTAHVEPESVILRNVTGNQPYQILEQNYRNDPISQSLLLSLFEGQTIDFEVPGPTSPRIVKGKIIRSGYTPHYPAMRRYGNQYAAQQYVQQEATTPVIETEGQLIFHLPGTPKFPSLGQNTILKPALTWLVRAPAAGKTNAELSYVSGGMNWNADYNVLANEKDSLVDVLGWVTMDNQTGSGFENARVQLMAGDVKKIQPGNYQMRDAVMLSTNGVSAGYIGPPPVTERTFDEYHLYTLDNRVTLRDRETKQVEFLRAAKAKSTQLYIYDGVYVDPNRYQGWNYDNIRTDPSYGTQSNPKVWVMREIENTKANQLGIALPAGKVRFYKRDDDGRLQFTGENMITHTPQGERVRLYTGNAFDLVGERLRKDYQIDHGRRTVDESFEIKLRNRKTVPAEIRVVEHLYRSMTWSIAETSQPFAKKDSNTIEYTVALQPNEERVVTYKAHYTW